MNPDVPDTEPPSLTKRPTRTRDGDIELFHGEIVNRQQLAKLLHVTPLRISQWTKLPNGLPLYDSPAVNQTAEDCACYSMSPKRANGLKVLLNARILCVKGFAPNDR